MPKDCCRWNDWACIQEDITQPRPLPQSLYIHTQAAVRVGGGLEFNYLHFMVSDFFLLSERFGAPQNTFLTKAPEARCWRRPCSHHLTCPARLLTRFHFLTSTPHMLYQPFFLSQLPDCLCCFVPLLFKPLTWPVYLPGRPSAWSTDPWLSA